MRTVLSLDHDRDGGLQVAQPGGLEDEHREHGADRVDHDPLPLEDLPGGARGADLAEQGNDHRRPGHHQHGAEQDRERRAQAEDEPGGAGAEQPRDGHPDRDQPPHDPAGFAEVAEAQGQAPFVEDQGHPQRHDGRQQVAEELVGIDQTRDRPGEEADQKKQQDRGDSQAPRQPLRGDAEHDHGRQSQQKVFGQGRD